MRLIIALTVAVHVLAAPAFAQDPGTRAGQAEEKRAEKAKQLEPYEPSGLEKGLYYFEDRYLAERLFNPPRGLFARFGGMPEGQGFTVGPAYRLSNYDVSFTTSAAVSLKAAYEVTARLDFPRPTAPMLGQRKPRTFFTVGATYHELPEEDFWGIGLDSRESNEISYQMDEMILDGSAGVSPANWISVSATGEYRSQRPGPGGNRRLPSIEDLFQEGTAPAFTTDLDYIKVAGDALIDYSNSLQGAPVGGRYQFTMGRYMDQTEERFSFDRWDIDLQQYIPIFTPGRLLALRAHAAGVEPEDNNGVPFYLLPSLGGSHSLRAYSVHRFRDNYSLLLQAEYRFRLNDFMTGALFYDTGKVVADRDDLWNLDRAKDDYGISIRFGFASIAALRAEIVWGGDEGMVYALRFSDVF
jgi:hypothetical protein